MTLLVLPPFHEKNFKHSPILSPISIQHLSSQLKSQTPPSHSLTLYAFISTSVHYNETDAHRYLSYSSSHPTKCENSIPFSQLLRLKRLCSNKPDFTDKAKEMCKSFMDSGYPGYIVDDALKRISGISRQLSLQTHPLSMPIKRIIYKNFDILQAGTDTKPIFKKPPLMAFRRDSNLRDILVRSNLSKQEDNPGTYACNHPRCRTCDHVSGLSSIRTTRNSLAIHQRYSC